MKRVILDMESLELLSQIALIFLNSDDFDFKMKTVLNKIGTYFQVSRVYIFLDNEEKTTTSNMYEWCNAGIVPQIDNLQNISYETIPSWKRMFLKQGYVYSENVENLPSDISAILKPQKILSIVAYPLYIEQKNSGFIGFDECKKERKWSKIDLKLLKEILTLIETVYKCEFIKNKLSATNNNFKSLFNTIDDLIIIGSKQGKILHVNDAVITKLGYSRRELSRMDIIDLHKLSKSRETFETLKSIFSGQRDYSTLELESKTKESIPTETKTWFGRWDNQDCLFCLSKDLRKEQEALEKFVKLFENNPVLMAIIDSNDRKIISVNDSVVNKLGYPKEEIIGKISTELEIAVDFQKQQNIAREIGDCGKIKDVELEVRCKNGSLLHGLFSGEIIESQGKHFFLIVMVDITEQVLLTEKINNKKNKLENIIEGTQLGTWEWGVKSGELIVNERFTEIFGYVKEELMPISIETWMEHTQLDDLKKSYDSLKKHFEGESKYYTAEFRMKHKSGNWVWILSKGKVIEWEEGQPVKMFGTHSDITEKKQLEEKIKKLSIRDSLTNTYNRRHIFDQLEFFLLEFFKTEENFTASIIDIDYFKNINDKYGHQVGDFILREFTQIIKKNIRHSDVLGRYGGEEFIVISKHTNKEKTKLMIDRILDIMSNHEFVYHGNKIKLTFSCGISECEEIEKDKISVEKIIEKADLRLYMSKNKGRNRVINSG